MTSNMPNNSFDFETARSAIDNPDAYARQQLSAAAPHAQKFREALAKDHINPEAARRSYCDATKNLSPELRAQALALALAPHLAKHCSSSKLIWRHLVRIFRAELGEKSQKPFNAETLEWQQPFFQELAAALNDPDQAYFSGLKQTLAKGSTLPAIFAYAATAARYLSRSKQDDAIGLLKSIHACAAAFRANYAFSDLDTKEMNRLNNNLRTMDNPQWRSSSRVPEALKEFSAFGRNL